MKQILKLIARKTLIPPLFKSGYYKNLINKYGKNKAIILLYHNIDSSSKHNFEKQMQFIKEHMQTISLNELIDCLVKKKPSPPKSIVITLDDGYENIYHYAYPILKKYQIPATIFLVTGYIDTAKNFWWDNSSILSWSQIKEMAKNNNIDFGSHSINHYNLTTLSDKDIEKELKSSKQKIEQELKKPVTGFCYPFGKKEHYNQKIKEFVIKASYQYAVTAEFGHVNQSSDLFLLKRVPAGNEPLPYFVRNLALALTENSY